MRSSTHAISATPSMSAGVHSATRSLSGVLKSWWETYWLNRAQRATVLILSSLDDHTLRDIGLGRSEIGSLVYGQPSERTLRYDRRWR